MKPIVDQILKYGETRRGWIGVRIQTVTPEIAESLGLGTARGALVAGVSPGGPAAAAGLETGDIVLAFDGRNIETMRDLPRVVAEATIGSSADVQIFRDGETLTRRIEVARLENEDDETPETSETEPAGPEKTVVLGLGLSELNDDLRRRFGVSDETEGVLVTDVDPLSAAAEKGVRPGDVSFRSRSVRYLPPKMSKRSFSLRRRAAATPCCCGFRRAGTSVSSRSGSAAEPSQPLISSRL